MESMATMATMEFSWVCWWPRLPRPVLLPSPHQLCVHWPAPASPTFAGKCTCWMYQFYKGWWLNHLWSTDDLKNLISAVLIIWSPDTLRMSENVWECLEVCSTYWQSVWQSENDWQFDVLTFWCSEMSEKFWYQFSPDIQISREP